MEDVFLECFEPEFKFHGDSFKLSVKRDIRKKLMGEVTIKKPKIELPLPKPVEKLATLPL